MKFLAFATMIALSLPVTLSAQAANEHAVRGEGPVQPHAEATRAISQLKSPYCPTMLEVCSSMQSAALRDSIQMLAGEGWTSDELIEWMLANHGEEYRALPERSGSSLVLAWLVPPLGLLLGLGVVVLVMRHMRASAPAPPRVEGEISAEDEGRLRDALKELDAEEEATFF